MTNNYIKPELEMIYLYSEGVLAASASGEDATIDDVFNDAWN